MCFGDCFWVLLLKALNNLVLCELEINKNKRIKTCELYARNAY